MSASASCPARPVEPEARDEVRIEELAELAHRFWRMRRTPQIGERTFHLDKTDRIVLSNHPHLTHPSILDQICPSWGIPQFHDSSDLVR